MKLIGALELSYEGVRKYRSNSGFRCEAHRIVAQGRPQLSVQEDRFDSVQALEIAGAHEDLFLHTIAERGEVCVRAKGVSLNCGPFKGVAREGCSARRV